MPVAFRLVCLSALIAAGCGGGGGGALPVKPLRPATIKATPTTGKTEPFRVRVYADDAYRSQRMNWERDVGALLRRSNVILGPTAGIELTLVQTQSWSRTASSSNMEAMLTELEDVDPGGDVHLVVGMVDALPEVTASIHQLGVARPLGKHIIVRGLNDAKEVAVLEASQGRRLRKENRERLYAERGRHKMTVVFLHEVAHAFGAIHVSRESDILYPSYSSAQKSFSKPNATIMRIATSFRIKAEVGESRKPEYEALLAHLASAKDPTWLASEVSQLTAELERRRDSTVAPAAELSALGRSVRADHRKLYRAAVRLADRGKPLEAWEKAEPLLDFYPDEPAVAVLGCRLAEARGMSAAEVVRFCDKAAALAPEDITPALKIAVVAVRGNDPDAAIDALEKARARLESLEGRHEDAWRELAAAYQKLGLVSLAAAAASKSAKATDIGEWAALQRAKYSVPAHDATSRSKRFPPTADASYVKSIKGILKLVYGRQFGDAEKAARAAEKTFGPTAGVSTTRCDLEIRRRNYPRARRHCKRALAAYPDGSWTNYLLGLLHKQAKQNAKAIVHLERAIELDPTQKHAYQILSQLYKLTQNPKRDTLRKAYQKKFNTPLD